ncbi:carboxypeptidase-like regulatory domain-containing protein [Chryseobacterium sp. NEB161]|nr:carboxypeptidase-like regulatory domain-containing protein [Chryseobacterium sp. NEB161]
MNTARFFLLLLFFSVRLFSQSGYVIGSITNENGDKLPGASIYNVRTDQFVISDKTGNFSIAAKTLDELRVARQGYERKNLAVTEANFTKSVEVQLVTIPVEIEALSLTFRPTGNLKKDVPRLNPPPKVMALNGEMKSYMRTPLTEVIPRATAPSAFKQPDFSAGQMDLVKLAGAIGGLIKKAGSSPKTTANYGETQAFYSRIKAAIDMNYYTRYGMDEYDVDVFLAYADRAYDLAKNYRNNFNKAAIESRLKEAFAEYIKTHHFNKKSEEG